MFASLSDFYGRRRRRRRRRRATLERASTLWFRNTRAPEPTVHARQTDIHTLTGRPDRRRDDQFLFNKWSFYQLRLGGGGGGAADGLLSTKLYSENFNSSMIKAARLFPTPIWAEKYTATMKNSPPSANIF